MRSGQHLPLHDADGLSADSTGFPVTYCVNGRWAPHSGALGDMKRLWRGAARGQLHGQRCRSTARCRIFGNIVERGEHASVDGPARADIAVDREIEPSRVLRRCFAQWLDRWGGSLKGGMIDKFSQNKGQSNRRLSWWLGIRFDLTRRKTKAVGDKGCVWFG